MILAVPTYAIAKVIIINLIRIIKLRKKANVENEDIPSDIEDPKDKE
jgi:hypothetical protein